MGMDFRREKYRKKQEIFNCLSITFLIFLNVTMIFDDENEDKLSMHCFEKTRTFKVLSGQVIRTKNITKQNNFFL